MQWKNPDGSLTSGVIIEDGAGNKISSFGGGGGGGAGGGGAVTMADGANVTLGSTGDAAYSGSGAGTTISLLKWIGAKFASLVTTSLGTAQRVTLVDPATGNGSLVQAFHNSDNQAVGGTSYGLMTGGVDQLINGAGNLDRKRGVSGDAMAVTGLAAEVPMLFNGTNYDRAYGDKTNGAWVNVKGLPALPAGANNIGAVSPANSGDIIINPSNSFTRPANTTQYAAGQLVANSTTAGSVVPMSWTAARVAAGNFYIRAARMTSTGKTTSSASFILRLFSASPTIASGDGAAASTTLAGWLGDIPITLTAIGSDVAVGRGTPAVGADISIALASGQTIYGLLIANAAYTPISAEVETVTLELHQN